MTEGVGLPCVRLGVLFGTSYNFGLHRFKGCNEAHLAVHEK